LRDKAVSPAVVREMVQRLLKIRRALPGVLTYMKEVELTTLGHDDTVSLLQLAVSYR
jgi:hypothetical protein